MLAVFDANGNPVYLDSYGIPGAAMVRGHLQVLALPMLLVASLARFTGSLTIRLRPAWLGQHRQPKENTLIKR